MKADRLAALIATGFVLLAGSGITALSGMALEKTEEEALAAKARGFATESGLAGKLVRERRMEAGRVLDAFSLPGQGGARAVILHMECQGYSGKARFLCSFSANGTLRSLRTLAATDALALEAGLPGADILREMALPGDGGALGAYEGRAEAEILLKGLNAALEEGRNALARKGGGER